MARKKNEISIRSSAAEYLTYVASVLSLIHILFLVIGSAFFIANRKSRLAQKKILAGLLLFLNFCGLIQLLKMFIRDRAYLH